MNITPMDLLPALFALALAALVVWQLGRTHRKRQALHGRRSPWDHVGPRATGFGHEQAGLRCDR